MSAITPITALRMSPDQLFWLYTPITIGLPFALTAYVGGRLVWPIERRRVRHFIAASILLPWGLLSSLALIFWGEQDLVALDWLLTPGFFCLGVLLTTFPLLLLVDLLGSLLARLGSARKRQLGTPVTSRGTHQRGLYVARALALGVAFACTAWGLKVARMPPVVVPVEVRVKGLDRAYEGYRIVQLTDIHLRGTRDASRLSALVQKANALRPDLIAITGDIVDGPLSDLPRTVRGLRDLRAKDGVFLVLGNHEFYADADACVAEFRRLGLTVLLDEHRVLHRGQAPLVVAGVSNPQSGMHGTRYSKARGPVSSLSADPRQALLGAPLSATRLLLAHQPKSALAAAGLNVALALVGHTHGGQFFPWTLLSHCVMPQVRGLYSTRDPVTYVGQGLGTFGPRLRLGARPEIPVVTLRRSPQ